MPNPRTQKKIFLKAFNGNQQLLDFYTKLYDEAVANGSEIPDVVAWIKFREVYVELPESWSKREQGE